MELDKVTPYKKSIRWQSSIKTKFQFLPCKAPGIPKKIKEPLVKNEQKSAQQTVSLIATQHKPERVFHSEKPEYFTSQPTLSLEEGEESEASLQLEDINEDVSRIKRRVSRLNHLLGTNIPECPDIDPCMHDSLLLSDRIHPDILQIEISNNKLRYQLNELKSVKKSADLAIKIVREVYCRNMKLFEQLQNGIQQLESFILMFEKHQGVCLQRFRFLEKDKCSGRELEAYNENRAEMTKRLFVQYVVKNDYEPLRKKAFKVLSYLTQASEYLKDHVITVISTKKTDIFQNL
ncbi:uncharacterized protein LOC108091740 [Drosophila ficusphila]|uniref:uncharacterized protein LOC108091740 n=1 Tax=Drosophila ficusphila TaxID=30025 RepID=UPI0007E6F977|nr:uncharacterized protein LOC108091740 [Drosophila ficusphila]